MCSRSARGQVCYLYPAFTPPYAFACTSFAPANGPSRDWSSFASMESTRNQIFEFRHQATKLSGLAIHALTRLLQRSATDIACLRPLWYELNNVLDQDTTFFVCLPSTPCNHGPKTHTTIFQDTSVLLAMPEGLARFVVCQVEGRVYKLLTSDLSGEQWEKVQTLSAWLAQQHPDHVTNITRLWKKVMSMRSGDVQGMIVKDLGLLWQHLKAGYLFIALGI